MSTVIEKLNKKYLTMLQNIILKTLKFKKKPIQNVNSKRFINVY